MSNHNIGGIINNSMHTGLQSNLKDALSDVGVLVPDSICLWQYPEVIRKNLISKTINHISLKGKDIINISQSYEGDDLIYNISTVYDTSDISKPIYSNSENSTWTDKMSIDQVFNELFTNILPAVKGIHAGDITTTDDFGVDTKMWINTLFNKHGIKEGLTANAKYLRLYLTCQAEPLFIYIDNSSSISDLTKGYNVVNSDTVEFELDEVNMTMKAHIAHITDEQIINLK